MVGRGTYMSRGPDRSMLAWPRVAQWLLHKVCGRRVGWGLKAGAAEDGEEAGRPVSKAEEPRVYPAGGKQTLEDLFRAEVHSPETSGRSGCPRPWSAKGTEGCMRLRLHKASSSPH